MQREFPEVPLVGVGAIIIEDARVVLVKRAHPPLQAEWSIPGGVLEVGELVREAAVREAREETGLTVEPGELLGVYDRVLRSADTRFVGVGDRESESSSMMITWPRNGGVGLTG